MRFDPFRRVRLLTARLGFERDWYLILVAAGIGLMMSGVAIAFITPLHWIEAWVAHEDRHQIWWIVLLAPAAGALLTGVLFLVLGREGGGSGISHVMYAIYRRKARLNLTLGVRKWIGSTLTIGSGGSAGAEGPIVTIGSSIASTVGRIFGASPQNTATLIGCGAAAGIASVFNAPFAGIFFAMEILLRDFSLRTFTPIVIAAVISAAMTRALMGNEAVFAVQAEFAVEAFNAMEIPNYLLLGLVCGLVAVIFARGLDVTEQKFGQLRVPFALRPMFGGLILGVIGLAYILFYGAESWPAFYGNGYPVIGTLLDPAHYYDESGSLRPAMAMLTLLGSLAVLKALATCLTVGSGGEGGLFAPSLLIGAAVGGFTGHVVNALGWFPSATPAHYALVGMAAVVAATTHAPITAILLVYEITQSYHVILPLMFAAVISTIFSRLLVPESVYSLKLSRMGVRIGAMSDLTILRRMSVRDVPLMPAVFVQQDDSAQKLLDLSEDHDVSDFVVVDEQQCYVGLVTADDLRAALVYREAIPLLQVNELVRSDLPVVMRDETLDVVLDAFSAHDAQSLAVADVKDKTRIVGLITRSRLLAKYQSVLART